jgi:ribulose-5-phosphate 4-epimerase/fuculose-1-phosphate aldolase
MIEQLVFASHYIGSRLDLVQAGGGNTSVKYNEKLYVKASGTYLGDMSEKSGYSVLSLPELHRKISCFWDSGYEDLDKESIENMGKDILNISFIDGGMPSIETYIHAVFKKFTLHSHPLSVLLYTLLESDKDFEEKFSDVYICDYKTPGIELLIGLKDKLQQSHNESDVVAIILKNHGLIVSSDSMDKALDYTIAISDFLSKKYNLSNDVYTTSGHIFKDIYKIYPTPPLVKPVEVKEIRDFIISKRITEFEIVSPDILIYLGRSVLHVSDNTHDDFLNYYSCYQSFPSVVVKNGEVFIIASCYKKLHEIEDVLHFYTRLMKNTITNSIPTLSNDEICYLMNWDAEKYRKNAKS